MEKKRKEWVYIGILFMLCLILSPLQTRAKEQLEGSKYFSENQTKLGDYYYTVLDDGLHISKKSGVTGNLVLPKTKNGMSFKCYSFYFHKNQIYYVGHKSISSMSTAADVIYRMNLNGTGKKKVKELKQKCFFSGSIILIYGDKLYYSWSEYALEDFWKDNGFCVLNLKSKKEKYYHTTNKDIALPPNHIQQYYILYSDGGDYCPVAMYILNAKTGKLILIGENVGTVMLYNKTVYYIKAGSNFYKPKEKTSYLYSCDFKGKKKKKLATIKSKVELPAIESINKKGCNIVIYDNGDTKRYQYVFSSKKLRKN